MTCKFFRCQQPVVMTRGWFSIFFICPKIILIYLTNLKITLFLKNIAVNIW